MVIYNCLQFHLLSESSTFDPLLSHKSFSRYAYLPTFLPTYLPTYLPNGTTSRDRTKQHTRCEQTHLLLAHSATLFLKLTDYDVFLSKVGG